MANAQQLNKSSMASHKAHQSQVQHHHSTWQNYYNIAKKKNKVNCTLGKITPMTMVMYIDDGNIWVSPLSLNTNTCILQAAYKTVRNWLTKNGLSIDVKNVN
jgi:hypothetical protein